MAPLIKQKITQKQISFWKILIMMILVILTMDITINLLGKINPMVGTLGGLIALVAAFVACYFIIYRSLSYYNYRVIDDELVMEKVYSKANHQFLSLKITELEFFLPYGEAMTQKVASSLTKEYKFVSSKNKEGWYVGQFTRSGDTYRFTIEPNEEIINAIQSFNNNI